MSDQQPKKDPRWQPRHFQSSNLPGAGAGAAGGAAPPANAPAGPLGNRPAQDSVWRGGLSQAKIGSGPTTAPPLALASSDWRRPAPPAALVVGPEARNSGAEAPTPWTQGMPKRTRQFKPMDSIVTGRSQNSNLTPEQREALGFSRHYQGDPLNPRNRSANIPEAESCSLYIQHLPPAMTEKRLLDELQKYAPFGKVNQTWVRPHDPNRGHAFSAAKLVMFERAGAEKVYNFVKNGNLVFDGVEAIIRWNTQRVPARSVTDPKHWYMTRVLKIWGPKKLVNVKFLYDHWNGKIQFTTQNIYAIGETSTLACLIWVFASMRHQAELAYLSLKELADQQVDFEYAEDPLGERPDYASAYRSVLHLVPALDNFNRAPPTSTILDAQVGSGLAGTGQQRPARPVFTAEQPPTGPALTYPLPMRPAPPTIHQAPSKQAPSTQPSAPQGPARRAPLPFTQAPIPLVPIRRAPMPQLPHQGFLTIDPIHAIQSRGYEFPPPNFPGPPPAPGPGPAPALAVPTFQPPQSAPVLAPATVPEPATGPAPAQGPGPAQEPAINKQAEEEEERLGLRGPSSLPKQNLPRSYNNWDGQAPAFQYYRPPDRYWE